MQAAVEASSRKEWLEQYNLRLWIPEQGNTVGSLHHKTAMDSHVGHVLPVLPLKI